MVLFAQKYAPKNSSQILGQQNAVEQLKDFILNYRQKKERAALLYGPIGVGKTSSVYALAKEFGYDVLEINSSDLRNEENMRSFLDSALGQQSLFFRPKIILIDEIDNISGTKDRGCLPALTKAIETSKFPVVLTANNPFDSKFKALQKASAMIEYYKLPHNVISQALQQICLLEEIDCEKKAVNSLARQVDGDLRSALIDLQLCSYGKKFTFEKVSQLSDRKRTESILSVLAVIFKSSSAENALLVLDNHDIDAEEIMFWLDENLPKEYLSPQSLVKAYEALSRADVFRGRIRSRQHWRFLVYINDFLTAGISTAKETRNTQFVAYRPTTRILRMWQAKMKNARKKEIAEKLAILLHISESRAMQQMSYLQMFFQNGDTASRNSLANELKLTEDEAEWLCLNPTLC